MAKSYPEDPVGEIFFKKCENFIEILAMRADRESHVIGPGQFLSTWTGETYYS